ncbi:hypothetical protein RO3G_05122 [Lichtheimia corymbifera JMRC:FSU:9682]|uniref:Rieske domain-containing protein n=1 Tax=Lichtheimia corymbifera JMRC:FSU:9682 TaxID=1263082 RepID=A0A068SEP4_9FUNG|nr:hypothetical protein RO3G_05122 [Lichtheimia corymbifera JMRC:FSU:9682]
MFVPTIRYKRVNEPENGNESSVNQQPIEQEKPAGTQSLSREATQEKPPQPTKQEPVSGTVSTDEKNDDVDDAKKEPTIEVDPSDNERILLTLSDGRKYTADRYCPHAGADLSYLGEIAEDEYPPEIGPVLMCTLHYWEFALEKGGRSGGGISTLNICPVPSDSCPVKENKALQW